MKKTDFLFPIKFFFKNDIIIIRYKTDKKEIPQESGWFFDYEFS